MKVCFNGQFYPSDAPLFGADNRSYKWGDGLFETMKFYRGRLLLETFHFERLFTSLRLLQIEPADEFTQPHLVGAIATLCAENDCTGCARVRLAVYRTENNKTGYTIEAVPLDAKVNEWQETGLRICLFPYARKNMDAFANIKSASYLPYILSQRFAQEKGFDDALVLNAENTLCDSSKANLFLVKGNTVYTPALHQGCINGVMRRVVMEEAKKLGFRLHHDEVMEEQLLSADEAFLTNAIQIIRWVRQYKNVHYSHTQTKKIFDAVAATIFSLPC